MRIETVEALLADEGRSLVAEVQRCAGRESDLALGTRLRRDHDPDLVAAAVTQAHLRGVAAAKLGEDAASMWLTHDALEQATRATVAAYRADRAYAAGARSAIDLGCGIGADLVALARAGLEVEGVDLDEVRVRLADANLAALGLPGTVRVADAETIDVGGHDVAFVDPARRDARGRRHDPRDASPSWDLVTRLLTGQGPGQGPGHGVAKLAPGLDHRLVPEGVEAEWVSDRGDLVEACLWGRRYATCRRRVTVLRDGATHSLTDADATADRTVREPRPGDVLHEPVDAVGRAGLTTTVAAAVDGALVDPHLAYVVAPGHVASPFTRAYRVVDELPFRERALRTSLRERDVGTLTVKRRGVDVVPEQLVRRLKLRGATTATVVLTRVDGEGRAYLVEPIG